MKGGVLFKSPWFYFLFITLTYISTTRTTEEVGKLKYRGNTVFVHITSLF